MILEVLAVSAGVGALWQTARKGITVSSGSTGPIGTDKEVKWRARWGITRWIAEVSSPNVGWMRVGEYKTRELAESQAKAAAAAYVPPVRATIIGAKIR